MMKCITFELDDGNRSIRKIDVKELGDYLGDTAPMPPYRRPKAATRTNALIEILESAQSEVLQLRWGGICMVSTDTTETDRGSRAGLRANDPE